MGDLHVGDTATITGTVRTVTSIVPHGHLRVTLDFDAEAAPLCSQCGEQPGAILKLGTSDVWCITCLDEAADAPLRDRIEAMAARYENTSSTSWSRPDVIADNLRRALHETTSDLSTRPGAVVAP